MKGSNLFVLGPTLCTTKYITILHGTSAFKLGQEHLSTVTAIGCVVKQSFDLSLQLGDFFVCRRETLLSNHQLWMDPLISPLHSRNYAPAEFILDERLQYIFLTEVLNMFTDGLR